jgi:hypothetical protein
LRRSPFSTRVGAVFTLAGRIGRHQFRRDLSVEDRQILKLVGNIIMAEQKIEARLGLEDAMIVVDVLEKIYNMQVAQLSPAEISELDEAFPPGVTAGTRYPDMSSVNR